MVSITSMHTTASPWVYHITAVAVPWGMEMVFVIACQGSRCRKPAIATNAR